MRNDVVGELEGELLHRRLPAGPQLGVLPHQLVHGRRPGAAGRLVGGDMHARNVRKALDGVQRHDHLDRRAVGVGDDPPRGVLRIPGIDLRYDQRHVGVHAERARIVDHHGAVLRDRRGELARRAGPGRREGEIHAAEIVVVLQQPHRQVPSPEPVGAPRAALRSEQQQLVDRQRPLPENLQELLAHGAAGAHDCDFHSLAYLLYMVQQYPSSARNRTSPPQSGPPLPPRKGCSGRAISRKRPGRINRRRRRPRRSPSPKRARPRLPAARRSRSAASASAVRTCPRG